MRSDLENRITLSSTARAPSTEALENALDIASPCRASNESSCFKENININKCEIPKLSVEPLQMKRKKKGGGYNLRKSLAWDRAFFTEEGVLDPLELSVISGVSCREGLPFISEDTPSDSQQDEDLGKDRKKDWSSPKLDSSSSNLTTPTSLPSHKIPTHVGSKPGSRYGDCPRPLPSSSLKRPANVNVGKAAGKELKLPKVLGLKPGLSPIWAANRSTILRTNRVKHNQITQPDFSIQRHAEVKSSSKSLKNTQNASRAYTLQSAHHSDGNAGSSSFKKHSSINMCPVLVDKTKNSGPKMISDNVTPIRPENSSEDQRYDSTTFAAPLSQDVHISGMTMCPLQNQTTKPSGLRMPSPSLSFFSQPKPSIFRDLPLRDTKTDVFGSQKHGNSRLQDNSRRTPQTYNRIPESTVSSSKAISSRSECMASSHVSAIELIKPDSEQNPMHKVGVKVLYDVLNLHPVVNKIGEDNNNVFDGQIQDLPKKNIIARISHEEAELQKIGIEVPSQSGSREQAMDNFFKKAIDGYPVKSESCGSGWRNPELGSKQSYTIQESETISAIDEPPKEKNTCNSLALNHGSTQCGDAFDDRVQNTLTMQSDWGIPCKPYCHELHREKTDPQKYSLGETDRGKPCKPYCHELHREKTDPQKYSLGETDRRTDEDKNVLKTKERVSEQLSVCQQNGSCCSGSIKALEQRQSKAENPYFGSKHPFADLLKESESIEVLTDNLPAGGAHMQNSVFSSTIGGSKSDINLMPEVGDDIKQPGKGSEVQNICLKVEMKSEKIVEWNTSDRLLPEEQTSLQNSQQEENVEKLPFEVPDRKDGNKVIDTMKPISLSPGKRHDSNLGKEKIIAQPLISIELNSVDNSFSSESCNSLINTIFNCDDKHKGNDNVLLNGTAYENFSNCLHDIQITESDNCSPLPESRIHQLSQNDTLGKVTEEDNRLTSTMSLKDSESDIDNLIGLQDIGIVLVQSPESNMLNDCCFKQSESMALASDEIVAENLVHSNDTVDVYFEDNAIGSMEDSVTGQNEIYLSILKSSGLSAKESPLKHESCNDAYGTGGRIADAITDPSRVEPFSDTMKGEVSEDTNSSFSCFHPKLDHVKVEAASAPNNKHGDGLNEKSRLLVLPQNAIPFSDEWLAAIEGAGEDILTRKSGAVQNSPPDKSLPEPSPWSPVKRKNNQIGPFDCTKFTAPSDSS